MEQPIHHQFSSSSSGKTLIIPIIISIVLTALIIAGGIFLWMYQKQQALNNKIVSLENQIDQLKQVSVIPPTTSNNQSDELTEAKFRLAIRDFWGVREVFRNPQNKNQFYYISKDSSGYGIWVYDLSKDKTFQQNGDFNIPEGNTLLFIQKLAQYQEFRGVGIIDNKFIFTETSTENSPGPCFSPWFYSNLSYIDLAVAKPIRKPFILPQDLKILEEQKITECQNTL